MKDYISRIKLKLIRIFHCDKLVSDKSYLKIAYKVMLNKPLNLKNPQTFNEKLQWLKLYDRKPVYTTMVDKYEVKKYVADIIGEEYIIPTLGVWDNFDEIDFDKLPRQFVLKCTHDSGGLVICKDKSEFDLEQAKKIIQKSLKQNYFWSGREWPYKNVKPRIIAEKYMEDASGGLIDYKFFCFNGKVEVLFLASDRQKHTEETKFDFFDRNFNHLDFKNGHPNATQFPEKPLEYEKMIELSELLSKDIPQIRVDFYEINSKIYFGEMTFFHWNGFVPFEPEDWDYKLGEKIKLPERKKK